MWKHVATHRTTIDGITYETRDFPGGEAVDLGVEIMSLLPREETQLVVQLVVNALGDEEQRKLAQEVAAESSGVLADALQKVLVASRDRPGGTSGLLKRIFRHTTSPQCSILTHDAPVEGNIGDNFDTHFQGRLLHMRRVIQWLWVTLFLVPLLGDLFVTALGDRERADPTKA